MTKKSMTLHGLTVSMGLLTSIARAEPLAELRMSPPVTHTFTVTGLFISRIVPKVGECMVLKVVEVTEQGVSGKWLAVTCPPLKRKERP